MKRVLIIGLLGVLAGLSTDRDAHAQRARIIMDGQFADWTTLRPAYIDAAGDAATGVDFDGLWLTNDDRFFFLRIQLGEETLIQEANDVVLYLDTDDNSGTGRPFHGIGAELVWSFGQRTGVFTASGIDYPIEHAPVRIVTAPTVSSTEFEIAFDRTALPIGASPLFPGDQLQLVLQDVGSGDILPDEAGGVEYVFEDSGVLAALPPVPIRRARSSDVRVLSYNVERDGVFGSQRNPSFNRLLAAIDPDIIGFQEVRSHSAAETESLVRAALGSGPEVTWYNARIAPDLVVVSRYPIGALYSIPGGNPGDANGAFMLDLQDAWGTELLLINAHPPCCRSDEARQLDFDAIMAFVRDARTTGGEIDLAEDTPMIILGDMNMVGEARQLQTLLEGDILNTTTFGPRFTPDWDDSSLADLVPPVVSLPMSFTWYSDDSAFHPGRLDFIVYTDSVLEPANNFVLFTLDMAADSLATYGLQREDATFASDHLPVVGDFRIRSGSTSIGSRDVPSESFVIRPPYPNPFSSTTTVAIETRLPGTVYVDLIDLLGRTGQTVHFESRTNGVHHVELGMPELSSGLYVIRVSGPDGVETRSVLRLQ